MTFPIWFLAHDQRRPFRDFLSAPMKRKVFSSEPPLYSEIRVSRDRSWLPTLFPITLCQQVRF